MPVCLRVNVSKIQPKSTPLHWQKHTHTENLLKQIKPVYLQRYSQRGPTNHEPLALVTQPSFTVKLTAWTSLAVH